MPYRIFISRVLLTLIVAVVPCAAQAARLPLEYFADLPDNQQVQLSPDGKHLLALTRVSDSKLSGTAIRVIDTENFTSKVLTYTDNKKFYFKWIDWANNDTVLASVVYPDKRGISVDVLETRLLKININKPELKNVLRKKFYKEIGSTPQLQDRVIDMMPDDASHILLAISTKGHLSPTVYKINLDNGKYEKVKGPRSQVSGWMTDRQHRVRIGIKRDDAQYEIIHRPHTSKKWETIWSFKAFSKDAIWPIGFDTDPSSLYVSALYEGRDALYKLDLYSEGRKLELVHANENYDVDGSLVYSLADKIVTGFDTNTDGMIFWDRKARALHAGIEKGLAGTHNRIVDFSHNDRRYLVHASSDTNPGTYYFGDRDKGKLDAILASYTQLTPERLSPKKQISYTARDGLEIEGFFTLPKKTKAASTPAIIFPHGGPISYDGAGFDYWTQFFANRGYAVLQMNFRGSSGYGHDFMAQGLKDWGGRMQDDVEDGYKWLTQQPEIDAGRVCVVGASYGGYASLMSVLKGSVDYRCAVSFAGVTDLASLVRKSRSYTNSDIVEEQIGSKMKILKKQSPIKYVDKLTTPTLVIHGEEDRVVDVKQSRKFVKKAKKLNKPIQYIELADGTHHLSNGKNRLAAFEAMEEFLDRHLQP